MDITTGTVRTTPALHPPFADTSQPPAEETAIASSFINGQGWQDLPER